MKTDELSRAKLWALYRAHTEPVTGFGHVYALAGWLDEQRLSGAAPSGGIVEVCLESVGGGHFSSASDASGPDEWTLVIVPAGRVDQSASSTSRSVLVEPREIPNRRSTSSDV